MAVLIGQKAQLHYKNNWHLFGGKKLGGKAQMLYDASLLCEEVGFKPNPRAVLSMEWTEIFKQKWKPTEKQLDDLKLILNIFSEHPFLAIRSSANGDSTGTGLYNSFYCKNNFNDVIYFIKQVLESENSPSAVAFRKDLGIEGGMAIIIEPVIGTWHQGNSDYFSKRITPGRFFGPNISGCGYSSTNYGNGYIRLSFGLPKNAVAQNFSVLDFKDSNLFDMDRFLQERPSEYSTLFENISMINQKGREITNTNEIVHIFTMPDLEPSIEKIKKLESLLTHAIYFEWSLILDFLGRPEEDFILQLSKPDKSNPQVFPLNPQNVFATSTEVLGEGSAKCSGAIVVFSKGDYGILSNFNSKNKGYLLFISNDGALRTFNLEGRVEQPNYSMFNNCGAVLSFGNTRKSVKLMSEHFKGLIEDAKKPFMCCPNFFPPSDFVRDILGMEYDINNFSYILPYIETEMFISESQKRGIILLNKK